MTRIRTYNVRAYPGDDYQRIVKAANDASDNGGGMVILDGVFSLSQAVVFTSLSNVTFVAHGAALVETQRIQGGAICFDSCTNIRWRGGTYQGVDNFADLETMVDELGQWTEAELDTTFGPGSLRRWPQPGGIDSDTSQPGYIFSHISPVFRVDRSSNVSVRDVFVRGKDQLAVCVNDDFTSFADIDYEGPLAGNTLDTIRGTDGRNGPQDKQIILWCYAINSYGSFGLKCGGMSVFRHTAGGMAAGVTSNYKALSGLNSRFPRRLIWSDAEICDYWDNGLYLDGCFDVELSKLQIHDGNNNFFVKMHGSGYSLEGCTFNGSGSGVQFAGQGQTPNLDDWYGRAGQSLKMVNCKVQNTTLQGLLIQSDGSNYPRGVVVDNCDFINCGTGSAVALGDHPFNSGGFGGNNALPIRLMGESMDIQFTRNRIDYSACGAVSAMRNASAYGSEYSGLLAIDAAGAFHTMYRRTFIKVEGNSVSSYNARHFIKEIVYENRTFKAFITATPYSSAGSGGIWAVNQPPYAITTQSSATPTPRLYGLEICDNKFYKVNRVARLVRVGRGKFDRNQIMDLGGRTDEAPAMFCCEDVITSTFDDNETYPGGNKIVFVDRIDPDTDTRGIYSGNTESGNKGVIDTTLKSATFLPTDASGLRAWFSAQDRSTMMKVNTSGAWGDVTVVNDGDRVASWGSVVDGWRVQQSENTRRPLYKTNILNGLAGVLFDGVDDFLRGLGEVSNATSGEVIMLVAPTLVASSSTLGYMLSAQNEGGATPDIGFVAWSTAGGKCRPRLRFRNGTNDIQGGSGTEWTPSASTPKILNFRSNDTAYFFDVSDGAGSMVADTHSGSTDDGNWFGDTTAPATFTYRQSLTLGATTKNYQPNVSPTWAGDAATFYQGYIFELMIFDGDISAHRANIISYLTSLYGNV